MGCLKVSESIPFEHTAHPILGTQLVATHAKRVTIQSKDMQLVRKLTNDNQYGGSTIPFGNRLPPESHPTLLKPGHLKKPDLPRIQKRGHVSIAPREKIVATHTLPSSDSSRPSQSGSDSSDPETPMKSSQHFRSPQRESSHSIPILDLPHRSRSLEVPTSLKSPQLPYISNQPLAPQGFSSVNVVDWATDLIQDLGLVNEIRR